jgi:hypothetical protein
MARHEGFTCSSINWQEVESLFAKMASEKSGEESATKLWLPDLVIMKTHLEGCPKCQETLVGLAEKYGITKGTIFPQEEKKS